MEAYKESNKKDITYEEALEKVAEYILEMQYKDIYSELLYLLGKTYPKYTEKGLSNMLEDWNLLKDGRWEWEEEDGNL
jgi:predicted hydrocarbon binding protein